MPVYIVSWSGGDCMLVRCRDEDELIDHLGERGDPAHATWKIYRGPFSFCLRPKVKRSLEMPYVTYTAELSNILLDELADAVTKFAFPSTREAQWDAWDRDEDAGLELLLQAEIESKGINERSVEKADEWLARRFAALLGRLPDDERKRRIETFRRQFGWERPNVSPRPDVGPPS